MVISTCLLLIVFFLLGYFFSQNNHFSFIDSSNKNSVAKSNSVAQSTSKPTSTPSKSKEENCETSEKYSLLEKGITVLETDIQLERKTQTLLKQQLAKHTAKITQLKAEVSLYKGIVNDSSKSADKKVDTSNSNVDKKVEVYFQRISIKLADESIQKKFNKKNKTHLFKFSMTLAKKNKSKDQEKGWVQLTILDQEGNQNDKWKLLDLKGKDTKKLHAQFQNLIIKEGLLLVDKQQAAASKENKAIGKIKVAYIDSIKGELDINHEFDLVIDKDISYVGK